MKNFTLLLAYVLICFSLSAQTSLSETNQEEQNNHAGINIPGMNENAIMATGLEWPDDTKAKTKNGRTYAKHGFIEPAGWTGLSSYVIPDDPDLEAIFAIAADNIDILYNFNGTYIPSQQINTLGPWDPWAGYIAKFNQTTTFSIAGQVNQNRQLTLDIGWNLIPVLAPCEVDVDSIFQGVDVAVVKQVAGYELYWPDMGINNLGTLLPGKAYFVLMNSPGSVNFPNCQPVQWECGELLVDYRDGKTYQTVQIGAQCWMAENLNVGMMIEGDAAQTENETIEKYCYNNDESNCNEYGGLYQWDEVMAYSTEPGTQGVCPEGWYLPTDEEWSAMTDSLGGSNVAGGKLKETGFLHWSPPNTGATNSSGFTAFGGGSRSIDGSFGNQQFFGNFWTSTGAGAAEAYRRYLSFIQAGITRDFFDNENGFSVRCRKAEIIDLSVNPESQIVGFDSGFVALNVFSNTSWTVEENTGWFTVSPLSGEGNQTLIVTYDFNELEEPRTGEITITAAGGVPVITATITQEGYVWSCGYPIEDERDGKEYNTVLIGDQCWLAESLNIGEVIDEDENQANNGMIEKYCFENNNANCEIYGGLYQWDEMMQYVNGVGLQGICPEGWHLPSSAEWNLLIGDLDGQNIAGGKMKTTGTIEDETGLWYAPNTGATNSSGFSGIPAGYRSLAGNIDNRGYYNSYWSSDLSMDQAESFNLVNTTATIQNFDSDIPFGYSIRCIQDDPSHTYATATPVQQTIAVEAGEVNYTINSNTDWIIESDNDWITLSPESGSGDSDFTVTYQNNTLEEERTATISIISGGESFDVYLVQDAFVPELTVDPMNIDLQSSEGTVEIIVTSNLSWMVIENVSWFTVSSATGFGNDTLILSYDQNPSPDLRIGQLFVMDIDGNSMLTITVLQFGSFACGYSFIDVRDGHEYETVQIGEQCWMAENLAFLPEVSNPSNASETDPFYYVYGYYGNNVAAAKASADYQTYGVLYNFPASLNACPEGWDLPTDVEWCILEQEIDPTITCSNTGFRGVDGGGKLKEIGTTHWNTPNTGANNSSGFTALPGGIRIDYDLFSGKGNGGHWWSHAGANPVYRYLYFDNVQVGRGNGYKSRGRSVRCLKKILYHLNLEVNPTGSGTVTGAGQYEAGEIVTINAEANQGWGIFYWADEEGEIISGMPEVTYTMPEQDITLTAHFIEGGYTCGDSLIDPRNEQEYETVQIGEQCWMAENLNVGEKIDGTENMIDNSIIEKYCYDDDPVNCETYGGLYQWDEMMQYETQEGVQGICPDGWHIPTDNEWKILEGTVDSYYPVGDPEWDDTGNRGFDAGLNLKSTSGWYYGNGTNLYNFSGMPGGLFTGSSFYYKGTDGFWWSSSVFSPSIGWNRRLDRNYDKSSRGTGWNDFSYSVRCIMDSIILINQPPQSPNSPNPEQGSTDQLNSPTLIWSCADPEGDPLTYDVYFGSDNPPVTLVSEGQTGETYIPGTLDFETTYYWKIIAYDDQENSTAGPVWYFATMNDPCLNPADANAGEDIAVCEGELVPVNGSAENFSSVLWHTSGIGSFDDPNSLSTIYYPDVNEPYENDSTLLWLTANPIEPCTTIAQDTLVVYFQLLPNVDAGEDNTVCSNELYVTSPVVENSNGPYMWSVDPWDGGLFENSFDLNTTFYPSDSYEGQTIILSITAGSVFPCMTPNIASINLTVASVPYAYAGEDQMNINGTSAQLNGNEPEEGASGSWTIIEGFGGGIENPDDPNSSFTGMPGGTYLLQWKILQDNGCSSRDTVQISFISNGWQCGDPLIDPRDEQQYETVQIGGQCWMAENLAYLPEVSPPSQKSYYDPYYYVYDYNGNSVVEAKMTDNYAFYGVLYNFPAAINSCPGGWHLPSDGELKILEGYVDSQYPIGDLIWDLEYYRGFDVGQKLKSVFGWSDEGNGTNDYGFNALPGGSYTDDYLFYGITSGGLWWSSSYQYTTSSFYRLLSSDNNKSYRDERGNNEGYSVRCLLDIDNYPPNNPANPIPEDGALHISTYPTLAWDCTDIDEDPLTFDVYFGTENPPVNLVSEGQSFMTFIPEMLQYETTYYWRIDAFDNQGGSREGLVWSFTTSEETTGFICGQQLIDTRDGQQYQTVQIGDQCWMAENLNIGECIDGSEEMTDNNTLEKYCYDDDPANCEIYGGLYQWNEMMQYTNTAGTQGICPDGWHIPTDYKWKVLEGTVDSQYPVGDPEWDDTWWRGLDAGGNLKETGTTHWNSPNTGATNSSGFTALPSGYRNTSGSFSYLGRKGQWWSSSELSDLNAWYRELAYNTDKSYRGSSYNYYKTYGRSIRCIKN